MADLQAEFALATACCRWPPSAERDALVRAAAAKVDWGHVPAVVRRHRIDGLVWAALQRAQVTIGEPAAAELRRQAEETTRENLWLAAESLRLRKAFEQAGVPLLFVKGLTLGALVYGNLALKRGWDIDLLVAPEQIGEAARLLCALGYSAILPAGASMRDVGQWHQHHKESVWRQGDRGIVVELHSSLTNNRWLIPEIGVPAVPAEVEIATGIVLPTLPEEELFAYLCVHGASSAWFRLKWIADLAALAGTDPARTQRLYRRSQQLGAGRAAAQALLLAADLFETPIGAELERELRSSRINRALAAAAKRLLEDRPATELDRQVLGTLPIHLTQFWLMPGLRYKWTELEGQLSSPEQRLKRPLPRPLHFFYPLLKVGSWAKSKVRGAIGGKGASA